jgi:8-oxo-dGTP pyrophosphatase MutT (NUDIX family)
MGSQLVSVAVGVVFDDDGNVMLARTAYGQRQIGPPGGRIEQGESPIAAARREFSEETGFEVHVDRLIGSTPSPVRITKRSSMPSCARSWAA